MHFSLGGLRLVCEIVGLFKVHFQSHTQVYGTDFKPWLK